MVGTHILMQEEPGTLAESLGIFSGIIGHGATFGALSRHLWMTLKIVVQAFCHILSLRDDTYARVDISHYLGHEERIVCATQYDSVDIWVEQCQLVEPFFYKIVSSRTVGFIILH